MKIISTYDIVSKINFKEERKITLNFLKDALLTPDLLLKNRLVLAPLSPCKANPDGTVNDNILAAYDELSKGGYYSLLILASSYISNSGKAADGQTSVAADHVISGLKKLSDLIHSNGSKAVMQINHAGSAASSQITGEQVIGPSALSNPSKDSDAIPAEMSLNQIRSVIDDFTQAAIRVKKAGFDGVEIHSAHGFLLSQFLSPLTNQRGDGYGGDITGRCRIHCEIVKSVRNAVGNEFPILIRLGASDYMSGGLSLEESVIAAKLLEKTGINLLDISGGMCRFQNPNDSGPGYFSHLSEEIKQAVSIPVLVAGGIHTAEEANQILQRKKADLIGIGRAARQNKEWAKDAL
ncbi:MAG: NADH:flavin oxidoreductase [Hungatella sp.]|nr:NADH:flavin oxidoreductase [Hungatella sp.]